MQPFESVELAAYEGRSTKSSQLRPNFSTAGNVKVKESLQQRIGGGGNSPHRSPQRACSPARSVAHVTSSMLASSNGDGDSAAKRNGQSPTRKGTTHAMVSPAPARVPPNIARLRPVAKVLSSTVDPHVESVVAGRGEETSVEFTLCPTESRLLLEDQHHGGGCCATLLVNAGSDVSAIEAVNDGTIGGGGVVVADYMVTAGDIKTVAKERDMIFPRCTMRCTQVVLPSVLIAQYRATNNVRSSTSPLSTTMLAKAHIADIEVSSCFPSAHRCVISESSHSEILSQCFIDGCDPDKAIWIDTYGDLFVNMDLLRPSVQNSGVGVALPLLCFVEDVSDIEVCAETGVVRPKRTQTYSVVVQFGGRTNAASPSSLGPTVPPALSSSTVAKKLHQAVQAASPATTVNPAAGAIDGKKNTLIGSGGDTVDDEVSGSSSSQLSFPSLSIHAFRPPLETVSCIHMAYYYLLLQPLILMRSSTEASERRHIQHGVLVLLTDEEVAAHRRRPSSSSSHQQVFSHAQAMSSINNLIGQLESALTLRSSTEHVVLPILNDLVSLLTATGGKSMLEKALSMTQLRVQLQCRVMGISEKALTGVAESSPIQSLAAMLGASSSASRVGSPSGGGESTGSGSHSEHGANGVDFLKSIGTMIAQKPAEANALLCMTVETAHLCKLLGRLAEARKWYRTGLTLMNLTINNTGATTTTADETALLPFFKAVGDVTLHMGEFEESIESYEVGRTLSEMRSRVERGGQPIPGLEQLLHDEVEHRHQGSTTSATQAAVILTLCGTNEMRSLVFDSYIAVSATLGHQPHTAQASIQRCIKFLDVDVHRVLCNAISSSSSELGQPQQQSLIGVVLSVLEVYHALAFCCFARDSYQQAEVWTDRAAELLSVLQEEYIQHRSGGAVDINVQKGDTQAMTADSALVEIVGLLAAGFHVLKGWSALRLAITSNATSTSVVETSVKSSAAASPGLSPTAAAAGRSNSSVTFSPSTLNGSAERKNVDSPSEGRGSETCDEDVAASSSTPTATCSSSQQRALVHFQEAAAALVSSAPHHAIGVTVAALGSEDSAHGVGVMIAPLVQWLQSTCTEDLEVLTATSMQLQRTQLNSHSLNLAVEASRLLLQSTEIKSNVLYMEEDAMRAAEGEVSACLDELMTHDVDASGLGPSHALRGFIGEAGAVSAMLVHNMPLACAMLGSACKSLALLWYGPTGEEDATRSMTTGDKSKIAAAAASYLPQELRASARHLIQRDAFLLCRRFPALASYCFTSLLHAATQSHQRGQDSRSSSSSHRVSVTQAEAEDCVRQHLPETERVVALMLTEIGLDRAASATNQQSSSSSGGRLVLQKLDIPILFLDIAELRYCQRDYLSCFEACGRAIRFADERNLLYLLGAPLFRPSFQLSSTDIDDRLRLLAERRASMASMSCLGITLFALARAQESAGNYAQSLSVYSQCYACFDMISHCEQPVATEALIGCARTSLHLGILGDGLMYCDRAEEAFLMHHAGYGAYRAEEQLVELHHGLIHVKLTAQRLMEERNYRLAPHPSAYTHPALGDVALYL